MLVSASPSTCQRPVVFTPCAASELVMDDYLKRVWRGHQVKLKNWYAYVTAAKKLIDRHGCSKIKPSAKVAAMLDRMRDLDRNPLYAIHGDTLDTNGADQLF